MERHYRHIPLNRDERPTMAPPTQPDWGRVLKHAVWWGVFIYLWVNHGMGVAILTGTLLGLIFYSWNFKRRNPDSPWSAYDRKPTKAQRERARREYENQARHPYDNL